MKLDIINKIMDYDVQEILPGLWLGDKKSINNMFQIQKNIKLTVNCEIQSKSSSRYYQSKYENKYKERKLYNYLYKITETIHKNLHNLNNVLVYCNDGIEYSPYVVAAYLIKYGKINVECAIELIKSKKENVFISNKYRHILSKFQQNILS